MWWYLIIKEVDGVQSYFIVDAWGAILAQLKAAVAGMEGSLVSCEELDDEAVTKMPKKMLRRVLTADEVKELVG